MCVDESMSCSESCRGKLVACGGIHVTAVSRIVSEISVIPLSTNELDKPVFVRYVLHLSIHNLSSLLEDRLIVPVRVYPVQFPGYSVVFPRKEGVDGGEANLFVHSNIAGQETGASSLAIDFCSDNQIIW